MQGNNRLWVAGRLLTLAALAVLAGNAMLAGPRPVEGAGLVLAVSGIAATTVAWRRR